MMVLFVAVAQALHDADGLLFVRLADGERLEAALEGGVLLDMLAVFVQGGGADDLDLAAAQRGLQDGGGVDGAFGRTRADQGMELVHEQDDVARILHFLDALLQALFELAAVLAARDQAGYIEREDTAVAQDVGNLVGCDQLRQALDDRGLAHAGFAQDKRVVLLAAAQDLHHALDFAGTPDHGVQLSFGSLLGQILPELGKDAIACAGACRLETGTACEHGRLAHQVVERRTDLLAGHAQTAQHLDGGAVVLAHDT